MLSLTAVGRALVDQARMCIGVSSPTWRASGHHLSASVSKTTIEIRWHRFKESGHMVPIGRSDAGCNTLKFALFENRVQMI
jgi:hypothetical protein